jgi:hypothetical protein
VNIFAIVDIDNHSDDESVGRSAVRGAFTLPSCVLVSMFSASFRFLLRLCVCLADATAALSGRPTARLVRAFSSVFNDIYFYYMFSLAMCEMDDCF